MLHVLPTLAPLESIAIYMHGTFNSAGVVRQRPGTNVLPV